MTRVPTGGGNFIKSSEITNGDTAVIRTEADWIDTKWEKEDGTKQQQYVCNVDFKGEERRLKLTMASCQELIAFGSDSTDWVGKKVKLEKIKVLVGGSMKESILVTPWGNGAQQNQQQGVKPIKSTDQPWEE